MKQSPTTAHKTAHCPCAESKEGRETGVSIEVYRAYERQYGFLIRIYSACAKKTRLEQVRGLRRKGGDSYPQCAQIR